MSKVPLAVELGGKRGIVESFTFCNTTSAVLNPIKGGGILTKRKRVGNGVLVIASYRAGPLIAHQRVVEG